MKKLIVSFLTLLTVLINQTFSQSLFITGNSVSPYKQTQQTIQKDKALKLLVEAERIARGEKHSSIQAELLSSVAVFYGNLGESEKASNLLAEARKLLEEKDDPAEGCYECPGKTYYQILTAVNHAQAGQENITLDMLENLLAYAKNRPNIKTPHFIAFFAALFAEFGKKDRALELLSESLNLANTLDDEYMKSSVLSYVSKLYAKLNRLDSAMQVANATPNSPSKDKALIAIAKKYAEAGEFERAIKLNSEVDTVNFKPEILIAVAEQYLRNRNKTKALASLREAIKANKKVTAGNLQRFAQNDIVLVFAEAGEYDEALKILGKDLPPSTFLLVKLAPMLMRAGRQRETEQLITNNFKRVGQTENSFYKAARFQEIADVYAAIGNKERASEILNEAVKILDALPENQRVVYGDIAVSFNNMHDYENALKIIEKISDNDAYTKVSVLLMVVGKSIGADRTIEDKEKIGKILWDS